MLMIRQKQLGAAIHVGLWIAIVLAAAALMPVIPEPFVAVNWLPCVAAGYLLGRQIDTLLDAYDAQWLWWPLAAAGGAWVLWRGLS